MMTIDDRSNLKQSKTLNELLDQLEVEISHLGQGDQAHAIVILEILDEIASRFSQLKEQGRSHAAEEAQLLFLTNSLKKNSSKFFKELGGVGKLKELRAERAPDQENWWWFLDQVQSKQNKIKRKRIALWLGIIIVVAAIVFIVFHFFLKTDQKQSAVSDAQFNAEEDLLDGDTNQALSEINKGLAISPKDSTLLILQGIVQTKKGDSLSAATTFSTAEATYSSNEEFLLNKALIEIQSGENQSALQDSQSVISSNTKSAEAYYFEGTALNNLGKGADAYTAFSQAADLADAQGNTALEANARMQLSTLSQYGSNISLSTSTPTP